MRGWSHAVGAFPVGFRSPSIPSSFHSSCRFSVPKYPLCWSFLWAQLGENPLIPKLAERRRSGQVSGFQNQAQPSMCNDCAHEQI